MRCCSTLRIRHACKGCEKCELKREIKRLILSEELRVMEFVSAKRNRHRKRKRHVKKRRQGQRKFEVKTLRRQKIVVEGTNIFCTKEKLTASAMQADSFWQNYTAAQEWQKRHNVTWWKSKCFALEHENQVLRDKIRSMANINIWPTSESAQDGKFYKSQNLQRVYNVEEEEHENDSDNENFEFQVDEAMMSFLAQSMRHKIELKKKKESESAAAAKREEEDGNETRIQGGAAWMQARARNAKLLFGESSAMILGMETALQTSADRYKDIKKPPFWPAIPLRP